MTHGNELALLSGLDWVKLLSDLITRPTAQVSQVYNEAIKPTNEKLDAWKKAGTEEQPMDATLKSGFAKIAYSYGYERLKHIASETPALDAELFNKSMRLVIQRGGDTDTNAAIVGGLLGSIVGLKNLPRELVNTQLSLRLREKGMYKRSQFYEPYEGFLNALRLIRKFR